jgi:hypothetical protein
MLCNEDLMGTWGFGFLEAREGSERFRWLTLKIAEEWWSLPHRGLRNEAAKPRGASLSRISATEQAGCKVDFTCTGFPFVEGIFALASLVHVCNLPRGLGQVDEKNFNRPRTTTLLQIVASFRPSTRRAWMGVFILLLSATTRADRFQSLRSSAVERAAHTPRPVARCPAMAAKSMLKGPGHGRQEMPHGSSQKLKR